MLAGGFTVTAIGILVDLPSPILIPLMVICGIIAGALWAAIPGLLKHYLMLMKLFHQYDELDCVLDSITWFHNT